MSKRLRHMIRIAPSSKEIRGLTPNSEVTFAPMEAIEDGIGGLDVSATKPLKVVVSGSYNYFANGDLLLAKVTPCFENGKKALAAGLTNGVGFATSEVHVIRPTPDELDSRYLYYVLSSEDFRADGMKSMTGAGGLKRISDQSILDYRPALLDSATQRQIATGLDRETDRIDALIEKKSRFIELLKEKRQTMITQAVTRGLDPNVPMKDSGVEWLGEIPAHWVSLKFRHIARVTEGLVDPKVQPYRGMPLIAPNHIESNTGRLLGLQTAEEQNAESGKYICNAGDVIYSKIRPALAKVTIAPANCLCSADMYPLQAANRANPTWLYYLMLSGPFTAWATLESARVAMPKINRESLSELRVSLPPIDEQKKAVDRIEGALPRVDAVIAKTEESIVLLKERRSALITAAVTGQIDLREEAA